MADTSMNRIPVDYSFLGLTSLYEVNELEAGIDRLGNLPQKSRENRFFSNSIWLNNNKLTSMDNLPTIVTLTLEQPDALAWLDLSFNNIGAISDELSKYSNLQILYLHANNIRTLLDVKKLRTLGKLKKLTLCGNPLETIYQYRGHVVNTLPQIEYFDFSLVLPTERVKSTVRRLPYIPK